MAKKLSPLETMKQLGLLGIAVAFGAIGGMYLFFKALVYTTHGNLPLAAIFSLVIFAILFIIPMLAGSFKSDIERFNNRGPERILVVIFAVISVITFIHYYHFIDIEYKKDELKKNGLQKVAALSNLYNNYKDSVKGYLGSNRTLSLDLALQQGQPDRFKKLAVLWHMPETDVQQILADRNEIANMAEAQSAQIYKSDSTKLLSLFASKNLDNEVSGATKAFTDWDGQKVSYYYQDVDSVFDHLQNEINSEIASYNKTYSNMPRALSYVGPTMPASTGNLDNAIKSITNPNLISLLLALIALAIIHICMLLPFLVTERGDDDLRHNKRANTNAENNLNNILSPR